MGKIGGLVALGVIALTGCSAPATSGPAPTVTAAPIQAKVATASASATAKSNPDDLYLRGAQTAWRGDKPTDGELLSAAMLACEKLKAGTPKKDIVVMTGGLASEDQAWNNGRVVLYASQIYCPGN